MPVSHKVTLGAVAIVNLLPESINLAINGATLNRDMLSIDGSTPFTCTPITWDSTGDPPKSPIDLSTLKSLNDPNKPQTSTPAVSDGKSDDYTGAKMVAVPILPNGTTSPGYFCAQTSTNTLKVSTDSQEVNVSVTIDMSTINPNDFATIFIAESASGSTNVWAVDKNAKPLTCTPS